MKRRLWIGLALALATLCACSAGADQAGTTTTSAASGEAPSTTNGAQPSTTTSSTPPFVDDGRPKIVLGGDSVMGNIAPGVIAALGNQAQAHYLAQARISGDAASTVAWRSMVADEDPDLIIIHVGSWEVLSPAFRPQNPDWWTTYANDVLDPFADTLTARGAKVLFIGPAAARTDRRTLALANLNRQLIALADRNPSVDFLNSGTYVNGPTGGFTETLPGPDGTLVRIRRTDELGLHLCPAGVVRVATPVVDWIDTQVDEAISPVAGWDHGSWTRPPELEKPEQCPPV